MTSSGLQQSTLLFYFLLVIGQCFPKWLPMIPDGAQQVIEAGSNIILTCIYEYRGEYDINFGNIWWKLPDYVEKNPTGDLATRFSKTFDRNATHSTSTLILLRARHTDTGYYGCVENSWSNKKIEKYVYVYNDKDVYYSPDGYQSSFLTFMDPYDTGYLAQQGASLHIPCKPTHPKLNISVIRGSEITAKGIVPTESGKHDLLSETNSNWLLKYDRGLTLKNSKVSDTGNYQCIGTMNNITDKKYFDVYVKGLELTKVGDVDDPVFEGSNVTLICRVFTETEFSSPPEWAYRINNTQPLQIVNEFTPGIQIATQHFNKEVCVGGCKEFIYYESQLDLVDVTLNSFTVYQCTANIDQQLVSKTISFSVKGFVYDKIIETDTAAIIAASVTLTLIILLLVGIGIGVKLYLDKKKLKREITRRLNGYPSGVDPDLPSECQIEFLPYDHKRWEFPRNRLTLGMEIGAGHFGRVVKAEAVGIRDSCDESDVVQRRKYKTVAVKMVRSQTNDAAMDALISELKILIYLGSHVNVVNLLGACTKQITKGELYVIVEYCRFGNLQNFLINHRNKFINQLDEFGNIKLCNDAAENTGAIPSSCADVERKRSGLGRKNDPSSNSISEYPLTEDYIEEPETFWKYGEDPDATLNPTICTRDLISWSFQIARGMEYLANRKVLHGDLAARNVLLADDGIVKVADFGMAKKMYYNESYEKIGRGPLPVKWMAIESLTDHTFSSQSDVWSYGILLWELFSLGKVPYPGRNAKFELVKVIQNGYRMEKPDNAPTLFGEIMSSCWKMEPKERPTFSQLQEMIGDYLEPLAVSDYLTVNIPYEIGDEARRTDQHPGHANVTNGDVSLHQPRESEENVDSFDTANDEITQL